SSEHMTSGISAVMTLPCSSLPKNKPEYCPLLPFIRCIKTEYGKTVKKNTEIFSVSYEGPSAVVHAS
ncbi:MAG: hypothetical protein ACLS96_10075, partial [Faecalibacterium sp.]